MFVCWRSACPLVCGLLQFVLGSTEAPKIVHAEVTASVTTSEHPLLICDLAFVDQHAAPSGRKQTPDPRSDPEQTDFLQLQLRPQNRPD